MKAENTPQITPLIALPWADYALLDSGHGRKLERYGSVTVDRPEPQALWAPSLPPSTWEKADARFTNSGDDEADSGKWKNRDGLSDSWPLKWNGISFICRLMSFRHMGLFPEQVTHWDWMTEQIKKAGRPLKILNLFAYTGAASLAAAKAGAQVTHLDASKKAIQWAKDNQAASGLENASVRWICDDAKAFVARELRRGNTYDGILLDPPKFGRGPDGERWQLEDDLPGFLADCAKLLSPDARFLVLTAYAMRLSSISLGALMDDVTKDRGGAIESGELLIRQESGGRYLSTSLYSRWSVS
jgi:23S rRNA (cytosine1962-C5)-methyltransferase